MEDDYLSTREAAEILGDSLRTLYGRIGAGELVAWSVGKVIRIKRADLEAFVEGLPPEHPAHRTDLSEAGISGVLEALSLEHKSRPALSVADAATVAERVRAMPDEVASGQGHNESDHLEHSLACAASIVIAANQALAARVRSAVEAGASWDRIAVAIGRSTRYVAQVYGEAGLGPG